MHWGLPAEIRMFSGHPFIFVFENASFSMPMLCKQIKLKGFESCADEVRRNIYSRWFKSIRSLVLRIVFFIQLIQVLDFPLIFFDSPDAKSCHVNSFEPRASKPTIFFLQHDVFSPLKIFCKFLVVKSSKKNSIPPCCKPNDSLCSVVGCPKCQIFWNPHQPEVFFN